MDVAEIFPLFEPAGHLLGLTAYLQERARLASSESAFRCDPTCTRPGCKQPEVQIPVSLLDLLGAAALRRESVTTLYRGHYRLGLFSDDRTDGLHRLALARRLGVERGFEDPALVFGDESRHPGDEADAVGAGGGQGVEAFAVHGV